MDFRAHPLLVMTLTTAHLYLMVFSLPICPPPAPLLQLPNIPTPPDSGKKCHDPKASLEKCFDPRCSERNSSQTCEGIVSCYWCVYNKDSVPLKKPYCATAEGCFRGKEGLTIHCHFFSSHVNKQLGPRLETRLIDGLLPITADPFSIKYTIDQSRF